MWKIPLLILLTPPLVSTLYLLGPFAHSRLSHIDFVGRHSLINSCSDIASAPFLFVRHLADFRHEHLSDGLHSLFLDMERGSHRCLSCSLSVAYHSCSLPFSFPSRPSRKSGQAYQCARAMAEVTLNLCKQTQWNALLEFAATRAICVD